jgi:hypothetical protein
LATNGIPKYLLGREALITLQEVIDALKSFSTDKSLGPDGWTVEFYIHFFDLVGMSSWSLWKIPGYMVRFLELSTLLS